MGNNVTKNNDTDTIQRSEWNNTNTKCTCSIKKTNEIDGYQVLINILEGNKVCNNNDNWTFDYNTRNKNSESIDTQNDNLDFVKSIFESRSKLNIPGLDETENATGELNILGNLFGKMQEGMFNKYQSKDNKDTKKIQTDELSDTSPFISSDMYNQLINKKLTTQKGGTNIVDDSSTSSTSSSSNKCLKTDKHGKADKHNKTDKHDKVDKHNKTEKHSKADKHNKTEKHSKADKHDKTNKHNKIVKRKGSDSTNDDYISSSGGSNNSSPGNNSDENSDNNPYENSDQEPNSDSDQSGGSISNYNDDMPPSVVNTSDINMISES